MSKFLIVICLFQSFLVISQATFQTGYFIDNEGLKTECIIEDVDWTNHPDSFRYKIGEDGELRNRTLENTSEFGFAGITYERHKIETAQMANSTKEISSSKNLDFYTTTTSLRVLIDGPKRLLSHKKVGILVYYIQDEENNITPLVYHRYLTRDSEVVLDEGFKDQLAGFFDCNIEETPQFKSLTYTKRSLKKAFMEFSKCSGEKLYDVEKTQKRKRKAFYLLAGVNLNLNNISLNYRRDNLDFPLSPNATFSVGGGYIFPFYRNKLNFMGKISINKLEQMEKTSFSIPSTIITREDVVEFKYSSIDVSLGFRHYSYINYDWKIFLNAFYVIPISEDGKVSSNEGRDTTEFDANSFFVFGVGVDFKNIEISINPIVKREYSVGIENNYTSLNLAYKF